MKNVDLKISNQNSWLIKKVILESILKTFTSVNKKRISAIEAMYNAIDVITRIWKESGSERNKRIMDTVSRFGSINPEAIFPIRGIFFSKAIIYRRIVVKKTPVKIQSVVVI